MPPSRGMCTGCRARSLLRLYGPSRAATRQYSSNTRLASSQALQRSTIQILSRTRPQLTTHLTAIVSSSLISTRSFSLNPFASTPKPITPPSETSSQFATEPHEPVIGAPIISTSGPVEIAAYDTASSSIASAADAPSSSVEYGLLAGEGVKHMKEVGKEIGYMQDYDLDFGWGPTSMMQWIFEHIQVYGGLDYLPTIFIIGVIMRTFIMFPVTIQSSNNAAKMKAMTPLTGPLTQRMKAAGLAGDRVGIQQVRAEMSAIHRAAGVKAWKSFVPFLQIPVGFATFRLLRRMGDAGLPGMDSAGMLWFTNLTVPDPLLIMPLAIGYLQHLSFKTSTATNPIEDPNMKRIMTSMIYIMPAASALILIWAPAAVQFSFMITAFCALGTNQILSRANLRTILGMSPLIPEMNKAAPKSAYPGYINTTSRASEQRGVSTTAESAKPQQSTFDKFRLSSIKKQVSEITSAVQKAMDSVVPQAKGQVGDRLTKMQKREAKKYEEKRRQEISEARAAYEREQAGQRK